MSFLSKYSGLKEILAVYLCWLKRPLPKIKFLSRMKTLAGFICREHFLPLVDDPIDKLQLTPRCHSSTVEWWQKQPMAKTPSTKFLNTFFCARNTIKRTEKPKIGNRDVYLIAFVNNYVARFLIDHPVLTKGMKYACGNQNGGNESSGSWRGCPRVCPNGLVQETDQWKIDSSLHFRS